MYFSWAAILIAILALCCGAGLVFALSRAAKRSFLKTLAVAAAIVGGFVLIALVQDGLKPRKYTPHEIRVSPPQVAVEGPLEQEVRYEVERNTPQQHQLDIERHAVADHRAQRGFKTDVSALVVLGGGFLLLLTGGIALIVYLVRHSDGFARVVKILAAVVGCLFVGFMLLAGLYLVVAKAPATVTQQVTAISDAGHSVNIPANPANELAQPPANEAGSNIAIPLAVLLVLVAMGIGLSILISGSDTTMSVRQTASHMVSWVWAVPVLAVLIYLSAQAAPQLRDQEPPATINVAQYQEPRIEVRSKPASPERNQDSRAVVAAEAEATTTSHAHAEADHAESRGDASHTSAHDDSGHTGDTPPDLDDANLQIAGQKPPEWVHASATFDGETESLTLSSRRYATVAEALADLQRLAERKLKENFHRYHPYKGQWNVPPQLLNFTNEQNESLYTQLYVEQSRLASPGYMFPVHRAHIRMELSPELRGNYLEPAWRQQISSQRLWTLGGLVGLVCLAIVGVAGYLRMDAATGGSYRRRLKLATVSLIVAGGLVVAATVGIS